MRLIRTSWLPLLLGGLIVIVILTRLYHVSHTITALPQKTYDERTEQWLVPDINQLPDDAQGRLIRYGRDLIHNTALYLGPQGVVSASSNGMNCVNCHINDGTVNYANPFSAVASTYPKYRPRSGRVESVEFRVNECMQRSLNGRPLDSSSEEMRAMVAYLTWLGKDVPKDFKPKGAGSESLPFMTRGADTVLGKAVFENNCIRCHGADGKGVLNADGVGYKYPPLWGENSFNVSAGMYTLSKLAGFIKNNMPYDLASHDKPVLTNEQCWDVAAYISSQPRPVKLFAYDWKDISKKPVDYPFGPYADAWSEERHKYGPWK